MLDTVTFIGIYKQVQACLQAGCFALMICSFHVLSRLVNTKWETFFLTTFVWEIAHALDGIIIFMFYESFRKILCHPSFLCKKKCRGKANTKGTAVFSTSR
ncbi:hypothetical protein ANCCAN_09502 [Ancylostoma caninum]|uniref:7TM GPCR serpentine receptor class x (Srx) domain-containing protein n=1 Tax=Ancylostoma caninum TaxID=29170 RepID=A0A368GJE5_ANCCA|nr:hypothetical protein ANCCAN_09502 [Ancylostoma caninum]